MKMMKDIYLGAGCFWGAEKFFSHVQGVVDTCVGYANGSTENPSYEEVCSGRTGHVEAVKVRYDTDAVDLEVLLDLFYTVIDPTTVNRQGNDAGTQYRTGIYFVASDDEAIALKSLSNLQKRYSKKIAVECEPLRNFYRAEEYHQKYLEKNPGGYCHIGDDVCKAAARLSSSADGHHQGGNRLFRRRSDDRLRRELTDMQYDVTQNEGTEPPFQNEYNEHFERGIYVDITSGAPLFVSTDKFESGCGWPSFSKPIDELTVNELPDDRYGMRRTEVRSKIGDAHLGHVFNDGPRDQGGLRYCINSAALKFIPEAEMEKEGYSEYLSLLDR